MITTNYKNYCKSNQTYTDSKMTGVQGTSFTYDVSYGLIDYGGFYGISAGRATSLTEAGDIGFYLGSGDTPPTEADYTLAIPITSGLSVSSSSGGTTTKDDQIVRRYTFAVYNTSEETITVREIGACSKMAYGSKKYYLTLIERTVLDEPVVLAPGESASFTYKVHHNFAW